jgi:hypothetical protein
MGIGGRVAPFKLCVALENELILLIQQKSRSPANVKRAKTQLEKENTRTKLGVDLNAKFNQCAMLVSLCRHMTQKNHGSANHVQRTHTKNSPLRFD